MTAVSLVINIVKEDDKFRAVALTAGGYAASAATATALEAVVAFTAAAFGLTIGAPIAIGIGIVGIGVGLYTSSLGAEEGGRLYDLGHIWYEKNFQIQGEDTIITNNNGTTTISTTNNLQTFLDNDSSILTTLGANDNWDIHATIPSVSNPESFVEQLKYDNTTQTATVKTSNETTQLDATQTILKNTNATKLTLNNQTYNIASDNNNLLVRNALDSIPAVSVLLSHIDIYAGEKIDIGDKGVYTVKGGDTFSQIANNNGFNTKELLKRNTWLIDEGKIHFDQDKVLVDINASDLTRVNHTLYGTNAEDILKDLNGGYDTYIAGNKDTITDSDGKGRVFFNGSPLTGGEWDKDEGVYKGDNGTYRQTSNGWEFTSNSGEKLYFNLDIKNALGIKLSKDDDKSDDDSDSDDTNNNNDQDFSSPLILDLNHNKTLSTSLFNSNTYFDMDGDGFMERTAWMERGAT